MSTRCKGLLDKWRKNRELLPLETLEELCWKLQKEMTFIHYNTTCDDNDLVFLLLYNLLLQKIVNHVFLYITYSLCSTKSVADYGRIHPLVLGMI